VRDLGGDMDTERDEDREKLRLLLREKDELHEDLRELLESGLLDSFRLAVDGEALRELFFAGLTGL